MSTEASKKKEDLKEGRLHVRLDDKLAKDIKEYAKRRGTTLTVLVQQYFIALLDEERGKVFDAEQV